MKNIFRIAGILTGILLIFFFLQYANYAVFPMGIGPVLDCGLKEGISSDELTELSQRWNVTTFTTVHHNTGFFSEKIDFKFLNVNPNDPIRFGSPKGLLPTTHISYGEHGGEVTYIQRFWAVMGENADFKGFASELEDNALEYEQFYPVTLRMQDILQVQNLSFFLRIFLLLLFCGFARLFICCGKMTAAERHEGKGFPEIKAQMSKETGNIVAFYLLTGGAFGVYVLLRNSSFILDYIKIFLIFGLMLAAIWILCVGLTVTIVRKAAVSSLTGKEQRRFSGALFLAFGFIAAYLFITSSQNTYFNFMDIKMFGEGASVAESFSPAYLKTAKIPDDASMEHLLSAFDEIDRNSVYAYAHPSDTLLGYRKLHDRQARNRMIADAHIVRMSYNMLDFVPIIDTEGKLLRKEDFHWDETTLLIPENQKEKTEDILGSFYYGQSFKVRFIQSNQEHYDILDPSRKTLNAIYMLKPVERNIYFHTDGEVLYDENAAAVVAQKLEDYGLDQGTVFLKKLSAYYGEIGDELKLALVCNGLFWVMDGVFFVTAAVFGGTALYRFCKRKRRR